MLTKPVNLLLVEDDEVDAEGVIRALKKLRIANPITVAKDGVHAFEYLRGENGCEQIEAPYLIVLDINMPRMNGFEFLEELRADERLKNSIVFVLTTSEAERDRCKAYDHHIAGYLFKSRVGVEFVSLVEMLDQYWKVVEFPVPSTEAD